MWLFRKQGEKKWYWKEVDEMGRLLRMSTQYFRDRIDCMMHAMRNGYVHPRQRALGTRSDAGREDGARTVPDGRVAQGRPRRLR